MAGRDLSLRPEDVAADSETDDNGTGSSSSGDCDANSLKDTLKRIDVLKKPRRCLTKPIISPH